MNKEIWIGLVLTAAIAGGLAWHYGLWPWPKAAPESAADAPAAAPASAGPEPIQYPVPEAEAAPAEPLPALADSDEAFRGALGGLYGPAPVETFLVPQNLVARIVATIDSLDRKEPVAVRTRAIPPTDEVLVTQTRDGKTYLGAENAARYAPMVAALQAVDGKTVAELYLRWYPLFQQAYEELGYPDGYFNDRLIKVIDHLLETPELKGPHELVRPTVAWRFADPALERLSSGQKILLRLGLDQAGAVKARLREIRAVIAAQKAEPA